MWGIACDNAYTELFCACDVRDRLAGPAYVGSLRNHACMCISGNHEHISMTRIHRAALTCVAYYMCMRHTVLIAINRRIVSVTTPVVVIL